MPRAVNALGILIASPSDVDEERDMIAAVIEEWNSAHSRDTGVILEPIRWETHAFPASGERPQAIVDKQIVDNADAVIAIFGYRLGTPTGEAQSGTIEEIERLRKQDKPVSLYFSTANVPRDANRDQLKALEEYQKERQKDSLYFTFCNLENLRHLITLHLPSIVREVLRTSGLGKIEKEIAEDSRSEQRVSELAEKAASGDSKDNGLSLSPGTASETVKKYLGESRYKIPLNDFVLRQTEQICQSCDSEDFNLKAPPSPDEIRRRVAQYESITGALQAIFATGCYWGDRDQQAVWLRALQRLASPTGPKTGGPYHEIWWFLSFYPALVCLYSGGVAAISAKKYSTFSALCWEITVKRSPRGAELPLVVVVNSEGVLSRDEGQVFSANPQQRLKTPVSDHIFDVLGPRFAALHLSPEEYERAFDEFEYLVSLSVYHNQLTSGSGWPAYAPIGRYIWRETHNPNRVVDQTSHDAKRLGSKWPPLEAGLFEGSAEVFELVRDKFHGSQLPHYRW